MSEPSEDWWIAACVHILECHEEDCQICQKIKRIIGEGAGP